MIEATAFDFLSLVEKDTELRRVATTAGGEYAGPCPFCGGRDRFHLQPDRARWLCRYCTEGKWKDAIDYLMRRDKLDYRAAKTLIETEFAGISLPGEKQKQTEIRPAYLPPGEPWQEMAERIVARGETDLWGSPGQEARDYLQHRGLREETSRYFHLGYSPGYFEKIGGRTVRVSAGILLPCRARQSLWYVKIRLLPGRSYICQGCGAEQIGPGVCQCGKEIPRYLAVAGSATASIFNAPALRLADIGLLVEGEFDAMTAHQELACLGIAAATVGSATNLPDLATWGDYLVKPKRLAAAYDNDAAGRKGMEALVKLAPKVERLRLPEWKDINDFHLAGGDLQVWAIQTLGLR